MTDLTITLDQLAEILHISPSTAKQLSSKNPERLPPRVELGGRRVLFLRKDVEKWLEARSGAT